MEPFDADIFLNALRCYAYDMSENAIAPHLRKEIHTFLSEVRTPIEIYDFCDRLSKAPCEKIADKVCVGDIDSFGLVLFGVTKHYERPVR